MKGAVSQVSRGHEDGSQAPVAFLTRLLPEPAPSLLRGSFRLCGNLEDVQLARSELLAGVEGAQAIVCTLTDRIDGEVMDAAGPGLVVISTCAVGFDNIDVAAATARGILVATTPDVLTAATAELTWALILAVARRVIEGDRMVREGRFRGWSPTMLLGLGLKGRVLGVVGMGRIGRAVARIGAGFGMEVVYVRRGGPLPADEVSGGLESSWRWAGDLTRLLSSSDVVTIHVPLSEATRHLIAQRELAAMKPEAILINTARGPVVDEAALVAALRTGRLRGAGLDVYEREPELTAGLAELPNVVLLPHLGSATEETRRRMAEYAARNAIGAVFGREGVHVVNGEVMASARGVRRLPPDGVPSST